MMEITLTVKEALYERFREMAEKRNQPIEKVMEEKLAESLGEESSHAQSADLMEIEMAAYEAMHSNLVKQYLGEFVAITDGQLVDHDEEPNILMRRLRNSYPKTKVIHVTKVRPTIQRTIVVRSPKIIRGEA